MGEKYNFEDLHIVGKIVLKWVFTEYNGDWIVLAHDRYQQQAVVNVVANLQVSHNVENFLTC